MFALARKPPRGVKMSKTNCCNCGAALDIFAPKCAFCGTKNINMTEIDLASGEAANFIFKLPNNIKNMNGKEVYLSMLAVPVLQTMQMTNDTTSIYGGWEGNPELSCVDSFSLDVELNLRAVTDKRDNSIFHLTSK